MNMLDSLACLVTKRSIEIRGKGHLTTSPEERNGFNEDPKILSGKAKSKITLFRLSKLFSLPFLLPRLPLQSFGKCDKFTSFGQCNTRCKRNMQIEILSEVLEEGQNSAGPDTPESLRLCYLVLARAHYSWYKHRKTVF